MISEQDLREAVIAAIQEGIAHRRKVAREEASCRRRLRRWNMKLRRRQGRYTIADAYTEMVETSHQTLDGIKAWIDARSRSQDWEAQHDL